MTTYLLDGCFHSLTLIGVPSTLARSTRGKADESKWYLAAVLIWNADYARVVDVWMVQEMALELGGSDLEAAAFDELL